MFSNALGNLLTLLGVRGRKMEGNTKLVPHLFFHVGGKGRMGKRES